MKVGRNDLCPCGSGKKYKRCCLTTGDVHTGDINIDEVTTGRPASVQTVMDSVKQEVQEAASAMDFDSLEALNSKVQEITSRRNHTPVDDFCGLSPDHMQQFLYSPLRSHYASFSKEVDASSTPIMRLFLAMANAMGEAGLKMTARGNLPLKFCKSIADSYSKEFENLGYSLLGGLRSETDFGDLHCMRVVAEIADLITTDGKTFRLTKQGHHLIDTNAMGEIYFRLFKSYAQEFNWGYRDGYEEAPIIQQSFLFTLFLLNKYGATPQPHAYYEEKFLTAFPMTTDMFEDENWSTKEERAAHCYWARAINRFAFFFGLGSYDGTVKGIRTEWRLLKKTSLIHQFITFNV